MRWRYTSIIMNSGGEKLSKKKPDFANAGEPET